jgi:uncharacterized iron-regulated membrane protein
VRLSLSLAISTPFPWWAARSPAEQMTLRTLIFWPHLMAGALAGIVILMMSATGVLLTYERQLIAWSDRGLRSAPPADGSAPLPVEALLTNLRRDHPGLEVSGVTLASDATASVSIATGRQTMYIDAYTGSVLGESTQGVRRFMSEVRAWHRWIAVEGEGRPVARAITGWSNAIFFFIVVSGIYLWFPRKWTWQRVRPVVWFSKGLRGKARDFNWHNAIGTWSAVPLFIVVLTAMPISFPWANALVYRAVGEEPPQQGGRGGREGGPAGGREGGLDGLDVLVTSAARQSPGWKTINLRIPTSDRAPVVFAIDRGDGGQPQLRSTLSLDRTTGAVISSESFSDQSLGRRLRSISRFAHTGEVLGLPGQTIAGLATSGAVVLVWTGMALALRRCRVWVSRRRRQVEGLDSRSASAA